MAKAVLVVDDDEAIRTLMRRVLERDGYDVDEAADGRVALARIQAKTYGAVVLDLMMPRVSGYEVVAALAAARPTSQCVVIASAAASKEIDRADPSIVRAKLRKPFNIEELRAAVRACFESGGERAAASQTNNG